MEMVTKNRKVEREVMEEIEVDRFERCLIEKGVPILVDDEEITYKNVKEKMRVIGEDGKSRVAMVPVRKKIVKKIKVQSIIELPETEMVDEPYEVEVPVLVTIDGKKVPKVRYGIRYAECECIEAAYQRRRGDRFEARLEALESRI